MSFTECFNTKLHNILLKFKQTDTFEQINIDSRTTQFTTILSFSKISSHGGPPEGSDLSTYQLGWVW